MATKLRITAQRRVIRQIAVLVQAAQLGQSNPVLHQAVFASLDHVLRDPYRKRETVRTSISEEHHAAALLVAEQHRERFRQAHTSLMNASPLPV